jgi:Trypsin-like peptidase domain
MAAKPGVPDWDELWRSFETAVTTADTDAEERAITALRTRLANGETMAHEAVTRGLRLFKSCRRFDRLVEFADLVGACDSEYPMLRKLAAQGLIETKKFDRAIAELEKARTYIAGLLPPPGGESTVADAVIRLQLRPELAEVEGLLGRVYKQRCVDNAMYGVTEKRIEDARRSLGYYWEAYRAAPVENLWHGINYVALANYAQKNLGIDPPGQPVEQAARDILQTLAYLETRGPLDAWDHATRAEAALAVGDLARARESYAAYLAAGIDEFMRESTRRQLEQIWELPPSHELLALFRRTPAIPHEQPQQTYPGVQLEARFKDAPYNRVDTDPQAVSRARGVVRLGSEIYVGDGTGCLVNGGSISPKLKTKRVLLTCAHVCPGAVAPTDVQVIFFAPGTRRGNIIVEYAELLWTSVKLDASLLLIGGGPDGVQPAPFARRKVRVGDRAFIIGHPLGGAKLASLRDNDVREVGTQYFYYLSAADPGSSGSPVFNDDWHLAGMHRAGPQPKQMNEGSRLDLILAALRAHAW